MVTQVFEPRSSVEVMIDNGIILNGPRGYNVGEFLRNLPDYQLDPIVGAVVNGELRELTFPINYDSKVQPVTMSSADGARIYRRSLTFLLEAAFNDLYPSSSLTIDHSIASGGYYCQVFGRNPLDVNELNLLEKYMKTMVDSDLPFIRQEIPLVEAVAYFDSIGAIDKVRLLSYRTKNYLTLYKLRNRMDYHHGYMVPTTGYLLWFSLIPTNGGFTLRFPNRNAPTKILPLPEYPKLLQTFRQYGDWLNRLGISTVGSLNDAIRAERIREVILVSEALHDQHITNIAGQIADKSDQVKVVLIAGPSSSGKTTFAKRLSIALLARGLSPFPVEMDNYFFDRDSTPKDDKGEFDFESIYAMDTQRLAKDIEKIIDGQPVNLPKFNFVDGKSESGEIVQLESNEIIILEGIHGLNPQLIPNLPSLRLFRIYVSSLTQLNLDRHNRVSTTDNRLIRRIARDARERGYSARNTLMRWESVRLGEKRNIFPFQENADVMFNSALVYELSALKPIIEPLLLQVQFGTHEYIEAKRLLSFLEWFLPIDIELIPDNSILREFIGNSILHDFKLWHHKINTNGDYGIIY